MSLPPRFPAPAWERDGTPADLARIAAAADEAGFRHLCAPEHVALPRSRAGTRGGRYWDPFSTLGYLAAATERINLVTYVLVLAYHHPLDIVKRVGPSYEGAYYSYRDFIVEPGLRSDTPVWIGGKTPRSLRRAIEFADYWSPFSLSADDAIRMLDEPQAKEAAGRRGRPLKLAYYHSDERLDPLRSPERSLRLLDTLRAAGVADLVVQFDATSSEHCAEQIGALAELAIRG